jgi:hypothetical protein
MAFMSRLGMPMMNCSSRDLHQTFYGLTGIAWVLTGQARALGQHADEGDNTVAPTVLKGILRNETRNVAALANNDLGDNGSLRATSARAWAWVIGCRMTSVPAAPILTAPRCLSASASLLGRKVL